MNNLLNEKRSTILAELRSEMNGAVVGSMLQYNGEEPFFSYGVSLPRIKEEALKHKGEHELALFLFESEIRELKLAAIYIDIPINVTADQMRLWSSSFHSAEITDNASTMLFFGAPEALNIASEWLKNEVMLRPALMIIGKRIRATYLENERTEYKTLLKSIEPLVSVERSNRVLDGVSYALTSLHRLFPNEVEEIISRESTLPYIKATIMI